ncbi:MAG: hypothetical protein ACT4N4_14230 [Rhodospirillales bacterium]
MSLPRRLAPLVLTALLTAAPPPARAAECASPPDAWLLGNWGTSLTHVRFAREGKDIVWEYRREPGVVSERWGEKQPATARGTVARVTGCEIELKGKYTSFGGTQRAVGTPMQYLLTFDGQRMLQGKGLGFGKEWFEARWLRAP